MPEPYCIEGNGELRTGASSGRMVSRTGYGIGGKGRRETKHSNEPETDIQWSQHYSWNFLRPASSSL